MAHSRSYTRCFEYRIISRRVDVVWPPRIYDLTPLDYYLFGAAKVKCYADKLETIDPHNCVIFLRKLARRSRYS